MMSSLVLAFRKSLANTYSLTCKVVTWSRCCQFGLQLSLLSATPGMGRERCSRTLRYRKTMRTMVPKMGTGIYSLDVLCRESQFARVGLSLKEAFENLV